MSAFIYGLPPALPDSALLPLDKVTERVGGNTGNLAFCYALNRHLPAAPTKAWMEERSALFTPKHTGVLTLANQLGPHANYGGFAKRLAANPARLVGVGLGAQAGYGATDVEIPEGSLEWVRTIQAHAPTDAPNIGLRGAFTQEALRRYGLAERTVVLGCPTLFISPDRALGQTIASRWTGQPRRIAVTAGHPGWKWLATLEQSLTALLGDGGQDYICQSPESMIGLGRGYDHVRALPAEDLEAARAYARPDLSTDDFADWSVQHAVSFFSAVAWMEHLRRFDFVIGTRIHGVMLALQMGIPALCIAHDSRTAELCSTMGVPHVEVRRVLKGFQRSELADLFQFDAAAFDANRRMLAARYVEFLKANHLAHAPYLAQLAG